METKYEWAGTYIRAVYFNEDGSGMGEQFCPLREIYQCLGNPELEGKKRRYVSIDYSPKKYENERMVKERWQPCGRIGRNFILLSCGNLYVCERRTEID